LGRDAVVVADGLNYIKGVRYQLYCEAKAVGTASCVVCVPPFSRGFLWVCGVYGWQREWRLTELKVHVGTPVEKCREINKRLLDDAEVDGGYEEDVFENLVYRYEEPNGMTRWDSPLFTVLYDDAELPFEQIWEAIVGSEEKGKVVKPNRATALVCLCGFGA